MQITLVRYGRTVEGAVKYTTERLDVEAELSHGDEPDAVLGQLKTYVDAKLVELVSGKPAEKPKPAAKPKDDAPFDESDGKPVGTTPTPKKKAKPKRGRKPDHEKALQYALESENLSELSLRFDKLREVAGKFSTNDWEAACKSLAARYREINTPDADPERQKQIVAAFKAEKTAIAEKRAEAELGEEELDEAA